MKVDAKFWIKLEDLLDRKLEEKLEEKFEELEHKLEKKLEEKFDEKLKNFATKEDLKKFATKADLKRFATKADLKRFATKADLKRYATKSELEDVIQRCLSGFVTRYEFNEEMSDIRANMLTKSEFFDYMTKYEDLLQEIRDSRNGRLLTEKHVSDMDDTIANHERRIRVIEKHIPTAA